MNSNYFEQITVIGNKLSPINYLDECPSLATASTVLQLNDFCALEKTFLRRGAVGLLIITLKCYRF